MAATTAPSSTSTATCSTPSYMDWVGCCDHDNGAGREYTWWITQKLTDIFYTPGKFVPMFSYERSVAYPEGHRNVIFAQRGIRPLPRLPQIGRERRVANAPDTQMLYRVPEAVQRHRGVAHQRHEHGHGLARQRSGAASRWWRSIRATARTTRCRTRRAPTTKRIPSAAGGRRASSIWRWRRATSWRFEASSDHVSTHMSYCNLLATATRARRCWTLSRSGTCTASTDNILAEFRSGDHIMGDAFSTVDAAVVPGEADGHGAVREGARHQGQRVRLLHGAEEGDGGVSPGAIRSPAAGKTSYYYVRGEQADGEIVWVSPMWITYQGGK